MAEEVDHERTRLYGPLLHWMPRDKSDADERESKDVEV